MNYIAHFGSTEPSPTANTFYFKCLNVEEPWDWEDSTWAMDDSLAATAEDAE